MRTTFTGNSPLARLSAAQKLAVGAVLTTLSGAAMTLSLMFGWSEVPRPWGFILGLAIGLAGGTGVPLVLCGLLHVGRRALRRNEESHRNSPA